ncbi:MAG: pantoate--beta-alanine ligase [Hyphomicrobiaceae bacterium]
MTKPIGIATTLAELRRQVAAWRRAGERVALVPTMGALHDGHMALVATGLATCRHVIASIFVNPAQFAPGEDFERYPRTFEDDCAKLAAAGASLVWAPERAEMYREGFATRVVPAGAAEGLETEFRPHFFQGVATVCTKLFCQALPDIALFGEKDYQQLAVIRQIVRDLDLPLEIVGVPTVREVDGLAMSSRNRYLSADERKAAPTLHRAISAVAAAVAAGGNVGHSCAQAERDLHAAGFGKIDYVTVRDAATLAPLTEPPQTGSPLRVLAAAWLGKTRLIDNCAVPAAGGDGS